jgi:hypothetical protein
MVDESVRNVKCRISEIHSGIPLVRRGRMSFRQILENAGKAAGNEPGKKSHEKTNKE